MTPNATELFNIYNYYNGIRPFVMASSSFWKNNVLIRECFLKSH